MIPLSHLFDYVSHRQYEFTLGWGIVGQLTSVISFETFAMVFCDKFGIYGWPSLGLYVGVPIIGLLAVTYIGHKMIASGYAHKLQQFSWDVNKDWMNAKENIDEILVYIRKQAKEVENDTNTEVTGEPPII
jgi:hypothetical protein